MVSHLLGNNENYDHELRLSNWDGFLKKFDFFHKSLWQASFIFVLKNK